MPVYACDIETTGLNPKEDKILGLGYYTPTEQGYITDTGEICSWLDSHKQDKFIWQNGKFDQKFLYYHTGRWVENSFDTMLGAYVLPQKPPKLGLGSLAEFYLGVPSYKDSSFVANLANHPVEDQARYCIEDCKTTFLVAKEELPLLAKTQNTEFYNRWLLPASKLLAEVELRGIRINKPHLEKMWEESLKEIEKFHDSLYREYEPILKQHELGLIWKEYENRKTLLTNEKIEELRKKPKFKFNFNSNTQKLWLLKDQFGLPCTVTKYERGRKVQKYSVSIDVIEDYLGQHPIIGKLIDLNDLVSVEKQTNQLLEFLKSDGKLYTTFTLHVTDTGRLSSKEPNLQNQGKDYEIENSISGNLRSAFIADPGKVLVIYDLAQIEPRCTAHYSQDPLLLDTFRSGKDFYAIIANEILGLQLPPELLYKKAFKEKYHKERDFGKETGLSIPYGIGPGKFAWKLSKATGRDVTWKQAKDYIDAYLNAFEGITRLRKACYEEVAKNGYLATLFGRKVYISKEEALHKGINWKIQPSASDICLFSQLWVQEELKKYPFNAELLLLVHDEVVYQVPEEQSQGFAKFLDIVVTRGMNKYLPNVGFSVPLEGEISIGTHWGVKS